MKRYGEALSWAIFFVLAGVFLLLKNQGVFGQWGELIWGGLFAAAGLAFLVWFFTGVQHWWRAVPAFTLLGIGATLMLPARDIELGAWATSLVLLGMALGFWAILLVRKEHWWALVPAGVLTTVAALLGLWNRLDQTGRLAVLFLGIGLMFLLLYVIRFDERDARWAAVPTGALLLLGVVTLMSALSLPAMLREWWPLGLVVLGIGMGVLAVVRRSTTVTPARPLSGPVEVSEPPAPGASVTALPSVDELAAANPMPWEKPSSDEPAAAKSGDVDIYDLIKKQPKEEPPA
jgi:hypothetical protein